MGKYAENTVVPPERSRDELAQLLKRYKVNRVVQESDHATGYHALSFELAGRWYRIGVEPLDIEDFMTYTDRYGNRWRRSPEDAEKHRDKEVRRRWRVMVLLTKAKLEAISDGSVSAEQELFGFLQLPDGTTVGDHANDWLDRLYTNGRQPLLPEPETVVKQVEGEVVA